MKNNLHLLLRALFIIIISIYVLWFGHDPLGHYFLSSLNLIFHEAGHMLFGLYGETIHILGGSLMQVLIPVVFALYFLNRHELYGLSVMMIWLGSNLFGISIYVRDAVSMSLELLGGDGVTHDWNYLLTNWNLLEYHNQIAGAFYTLGIISVIAGAVLGIYSAINYRKPI
ncbi:MAG: hypothetical protein Q7R78_00745 [bacterium]|nr:hypothetical protein [bacterium]